MVWLDRVDSTNEEAKRRAAAGARGPLWVAARTQTAGRGRRGRAWNSAPGNLFCTLLLRETAGPARCAQLAFAAGLAVAETADRFVPADLIRLKWPNDVLIAGAKVSGCLLETGQDAHGPWQVIGVGLNLVSAPVGTPFPATHLSAHLRPGAPVPAPEKALEHLDTALSRWRTIWAGQGFAPLRTAFLARAAGLGEPATARLADGSEVSGVFEDIDETGALVLRLVSGVRRAISAADVFYPPPFTGEGDHAKHGGGGGGPHRRVP